MEKVDNSIVTPYFTQIFNGIISIIVLYLYIFQPPLIAKEYYVVIQFVIILVYSINNKFFMSSFFKKFKIEFNIIFAIIIYATIRDLINGAEVYSIRFTAWFFQSFIFAYFLVVIFERVNLNRKTKIDTISLLYWTVFIAAVFTSLFIFNSDLDNFYKSIQLDDFEIYTYNGVRARAYGASENLVFTYSYVLGFFAGYTLLVIKKNKLLVVPLVLFIIGVAFNARIGFFPILISLGILMFTGKIRSLLVITLLSILTVIIVLTFFSVQLETYAYNQTWALDFFYEMSDTFFGTNFYGNIGGSTVDTLLGRFVVLPNSMLHWIFGSGESIYLKEVGSNSDVGFILQLNYGGLSLLFLIILLIGYTSKRLYKTKGLKHWFFISFILSIIILNIKGFAFAATPGARMLFFIYVYFIYTSKLSKIKSSDIAIRSSKRFFNGLNIKY